MFQTENNLTLDTNELRKTRSKDFETSLIIKSLIQKIWKAADAVLSEWVKMEFDQITTQYQILNLF